MGAFLLALIGMLFWGVAPIFGKMGMTRVQPAVGLYLRTLVAASLVLGWMIASGGFTALRGVPTRSWFWLTLEAICATLLGDLAYLGALKCGTASTVTLVLSAAPLITLVLSLVFLQERLHFAQILGAILVVIGLWLLNSSCR